jgi:Ethanolamine utilization protein
MKKLICAKDIETAHENGDQTVCLDNNTILTPSAKDLADNYQMTLQEECSKTDNKTSNDLPQNISKEVLVEMLKQLLSGSKNDGPFIYKQDESGLKTVDGKSVKMDVFDTGNPDANVHFQEIVNKDESHMSAGFLEIDHSSFDWELTYEEIDYVIEGTLEVTIKGTKYTAHAGDVVFVPKNSKVTWGSPDKAKLFYATYPANWADLV